MHISKSEEHSHADFDIRAKKDTYLRNDVEDFMIKNSTNLDGLVDMLLDNRLFHARFTDPEYPM